MTGGKNDYINRELRLVVGKRGPKGMGGIGHWSPVYPIDLGLDTQQLVRSGLAIASLMTLPTLRGAIALAGILPTRSSAIARVILRDFSNRNR